MGRICVHDKETFHPFRITQRVRPANQATPILDD